MPSRRRRFERTPYFPPFPPSPQIFFPNCSSRHLRTSFPISDISYLLLAQVFWAYPNKGPRVVLPIRCFFVFLRTAHPARVPSLPFLPETCALPLADWKGGCMFSLVLLLWLRPLLFFCPVVRPLPSWTFPLLSVNKASPLLFTEPQQVLTTDPCLTHPHDPLPKLFPVMTFFPVWNCRGKSSRQYRLLLAAGACAGPI